MGSPLLDRLCDELDTGSVGASDSSFWPDRNVALEVQAWTERSADSDEAIFYWGLTPAWLLAGISVTDIGRRVDRTTRVV